MIRGVLRGAADEETESAIGRLPSLGVVGADGVDVLGPVGGELLTRQAHVIVMPQPDLALLVVLIIADVVLKPFS